MPTQVTIRENRKPFKITINKEVTARIMKTGKSLLIDFCTPQCLECSICRIPLVAEKKKKLKKCHICGQVHKTNLFCPNGHFVCENCWKKIAGCPWQNPERMRLFLAEKYGILPSDIELVELNL